jgi:hypothetical protein
MRGWDLILGVVVARADGALEFLDSLAEGATGFGEAFGSEDEKRDDQHNDQVGGLKDVGKHGVVLCYGGRAARMRGPRRPVPGAGGAE